MRRRSFFGALVAAVAAVKAGRSVAPSVTPEQAIYGAARAPGTKLHELREAAVNRAVARFSYSSREHPHFAAYAREQHRLALERNRRDVARMLGVDV